MLTVKLITPSTSAFILFVTFLLSTQVWFIVSSKQTYYFSRHIWRQSNSKGIIQDKTINVSVIPHPNLCHSISSVREKISVESLKSWYDQYISQQMHSSSMSYLIYRLRYPHQTLNQLLFVRDKTHHHANLYHSIQSTGGKRWYNIH